MSKKNVTIYTDGACSGNPGPGGWGAILYYGDHAKEIYGGVKDTTNNRMEIQAAIEALNCLKSACNVTLYTDSVYVKNGVLQWMPNWKRNNWRGSNKKEIKNRDLWEALDAATQRHDIQWKWVKGHSGVEGNERADMLAVKGSEEAKC